jgi:hypothetical protein
MEPRARGSWRPYLAAVPPQADRARWDTIMGLFRRTPRPERAGRKPSMRERRAAERTAAAEAKLTQTEQRIHQLADDVRRDLKN